MAWPIRVCSVYEELETAEGELRVVTVAEREEIVIILDDHVATSVLYHFFPPLPVRFFCEPAFRGGFRFSSPSPRMIWPSASTGDLPHSSEHRPPSSPTGNAGQMHPPHRATKDDGDDRDNGNDSDDENQFCHHVRSLPLAGKGENKSTKGVRPDHRLARLCEAGRLRTAARSPPLSLEGSLSIVDVKGAQGKSPEHFFCRKFGLGGQSNRMS